jgi:hypothetical protein
VRSFCLFEWRRLQSRHSQQNALTTLYDPCNESSYLAYLIPLLLSDQASSRRLFLLYPTAPKSPHSLLAYPQIFRRSSLLEDFILKTITNIRLYGATTTIMAGPEISKQYVPLTCHGHSRPVTHLSFSGFVGGEDEYYMISACKGSHIVQTNLGHC